MRLSHLLLAAPIVLAVASPALADCDEELHSLRKKIESDPSKPKHLLTVHTSGYKFTR